MYQLRLINSALQVASLVAGFLSISVCLYASNEIDSSDQPFQNFPPLSHTFSVLQDDAEELNLSGKFQTVGSFKRYLEEHPFSKSLKKLDLSNNKIRDNDLEAIMDLHHLTLLNLAKTEIGVNGVKKLTNLQDLTAVNLSSNSMIGKPGVDAISQLPKLIHLALDYCNLNYDDIASLDGKKLQGLSLRGNFNRSSNKYFPELKELSYLDLANSGHSINLPGNKSLSHFSPNLTYLDISRIRAPQFIDKRMLGSILSDFPHLVFFNLNGNTFLENTSELMTEQYPNLVELRMDNCKVVNSDAAILAIGLPHLKKLDLRGSKVSKLIQERMRKAFPNLELAF